MNVELAILDTSERGVQVALNEDAPPFWLPRTAPGLVWSTPPEIGDVVCVRLPGWMIAKHRQLKELQYQRSFAFQQPLAGLGLAQAERAIPMSEDRQSQGRGAMFRIPDADRKNDKWPEMRGDLTLPDGAKLELAGWFKLDKNGKRYLSLASKPFQERRPAEQQRQPEPQSNTYAAARGRDEPQRQPAGGPSFADGEIPF